MTPPALLPASGRRNERSEMRIPDNAIKVKSGDTTAYIINETAPDYSYIEIVDQFGTTEIEYRMVDRDDAALQINLNAYERGKRAKHMSFSMPREVAIEFARRILGISA